MELGVGRVPPQAVQQNRQSGKVPEQNDQKPVRRRQPERSAGDCIFVDCHTAFLIQVVKVQPRGVPRQQGEQRKQNRPLVSAVRFGNHREEVKHQQNRRRGSGTKRQRNREGAAGRVPQKQRQKQRAGGRNADDRRNPAGAEAVLRLSAEQIKQRGEGGQQQKPQDGLTVKSNGMLVRLPFSQLSYVEVNGKHLFFNMADGTVYEVAASMREYEGALLARPEFMRVHRSYIVNMLQAEKLSPAGVITFSGHNVPVSRLLYGQLQKDYLALLFSGRDA